MPMTQKNEKHVAVSYFFEAFFTLLFDKSDGEGADLAASAESVVRRTYRPDLPLITSPHKLPVCRLLSEAYRYSRETPLAAVIEALEAIEPLLLWQQNPNYTNENMGSGYMENYGYANLIGRLGLIPSSEVAVGVGLWGPAFIYPLHHHPAEELYLLLGAPTSFYTERHGWREVPTGGIVHTRPWEKHAMRFENGPSLMGYLWQGEVRTQATLTG